LNKRGNRKEVIEEAADSFWRSLMKIRHQLLNEEEEKGTKHASITIPKKVSLIYLQSCKDGHKGRWIFRVNKITSIRYPTHMV
jgi:hypothetical protein